MEKLFILNEITGSEKRIVSVNSDIEIVLNYLRSHQYLVVPDNVGNGWEILKLQYDKIGNARTSLIVSEINNGGDFKIKLVVGKVYHLLAGLHIGEISDIMYLSNMKCIDVDENGYILQGVPGSIGSMQESIYVYKDEIFSVFDKDLYDCISSR
jgi:hypothetical protein